MCKWYYPIPPRGDYDILYMIIIIIIIIILTLILRQDNLARHKDQEMTCLALSQLVGVFKHLDLRR